MTDYKTLIRLNIEIEGLLHVLSTRESEATRQMLDEKYTQYKQLIEELLYGNAHEVDVEKKAKDVAETLTEDEVKDQEAVEGEEDDETGLATEAIERGEEKVRVDEAMLRMSARDLRRAFTLNDKFRFRRYLFGNDDVLFAETLDKLSTMTSFDEARKYLFTNMQWDLESDEVKDFMSIVENHFA